MDDNTNNNNNNNNKTRRRIIEIIIIIIILLLLLWSCKSGLLGNGKGDKGKTKTSTKVQEEVQKASVYPSAIGDLVYSGKAQALVSKGKAGKGCRFVYSLSEDGTFTKKVPTMTDAGSYVVYWRRIKNGKVVEKGSIPVSIAKAQDKATVVGAAFAEDGTPHNLIASASTKFGAVIEYSLDGANYSTAIPQATKAGSYKVYWRSKGNSNYAGDSGSLVVTVADKVKPEVKIAFNDELTYNGKKQEFVGSVKVPEGVTVEYKLGDGEWTTNLNEIKASKPGTYTVQYRTVETAKYAVTEGSKDIIIDKAELYSVEFTEAELLPYIHSGQEQKVTISKVMAGKEGDLVEVDPAEYGEGAYTVSGTLKATDIGTYTVTAKAAFGSEYFTGSVDATWSIKGQFAEKALTIKGSDSQWTVSGANYDFTGEEIEPDFKVVNKGGTELRLGTDYEVVEDSVTKATNADTYTIKVKGIGDYAAGINTAEATWTINSVEFGTVEASYTEVEYSGNEEIPEITVKNSDGEELEEGTDYTIAIFDEDGQPATPIEQGTYTAVITGKGNYKGSKEVTWTITEDYIARIGSVRFGSLQKALNYVQEKSLSNPTIVMIQDVTDAESTVVPDGVTATIDFAKYSYTIGDDNTFKIGDNATLTIKNGTINGCLTVGSNGASSTGSKLTIESNATINNSGECAVETFGDTTLDVSGVINGRVEGNTGSVINVRQNAEITEDSDVAIYIPGATLNVLGGTIQGKTAVYFKSGNLTITGGSLVGNGAKQSYSSKTEDYIATGDALVVDNDGIMAISTVKVEGGYFYSENASSIGSYAAGGSVPMNGFVLGGYFRETAAEMNSSGLILDCQQKTGYAATATDEPVSSTYLSHVTDFTVKQYTVTTGSYGYATVQKIGSVEEETILVEGIDTPAISPAATNDAGTTVLLTTSKSKKVTIPDVSDQVSFRLDGWDIRTGTSAENYTYTSISSDRNGSISYVPVGDVTIVARYVMAETPVYQLTIVADHFKTVIGGTTEDKETKAVYNLKEGTEVTVTYTGSRIFRYWKNDSNQIVSNSAEYTFRLGSQTTLTAVTEDPASTERTLEFISADGMELSTVTVYKDKINQLTLRNAPNKAGWIFKEWIVKDGTTELGRTTSDAGLREIVTNNFDTASSFSVVASYIRDTETRVLTIKYPNGVTETKNVVKNSTENVTVSQTIEDKVFAYWASDEEGTQILSYNTTYGVFVDADKTIYAIYKDEEVEKVPTVVLVGSEKLTDSNNNPLIRVSFSWSIPEEYKLIEQGLIYSIWPINKEDLIVENADQSLKGVTKKKGQLSTNIGTDSVDVPMTGREAYELKARGYIIYYKEVDGTAEYLYTDDWFCKKYGDM